MENIEKARLTLHENVVSTDYVVILEDGLCYKGHNRATIKVVYNLYANEWCDREERKYFKTLENAINWYEKNFRDRAIEQGREWLSEDDVENPSDEECINEFENLTLYCEY